MKHHTLKTWPQEFRAVKNKTKTFEFRKNDRDFQTGDTLELLEYIPTGAEISVDSQPAGRIAGGLYTGEKVYAVVEYIVRGPLFCIPEGYCVMLIKTAESGQPDDYWKNRALQAEAHLNPKEELDPKSQHGRSIECPRCGRRVPTVEGVKGGVAVHFCAPKVIFPGQAPESAVENNKKENHVIV